MHNRYIFDARIFGRKFKGLLTLFCADVPAWTASCLTLVKRKTNQCLYGLLRPRVVKTAMEEARPLSEEVMKRAPDADTPTAQVWFVGEA